MRPAGRTVLLLAGAALLVALLARGMTFFGPATLDPSENAPSPSQEGVAVHLSYPISGAESESGAALAASPSMWAPSAPNESDAWIRALPVSRD